MYENVGSKIKTLAKVVGILFLIAGIIVCLVYLTDSTSWGDWIGWVSLVMGVLSFISSWLLYGFGQLVDDVQQIRENSEKKPSGNDLPML